MEFVCNYEKLFAAKWKSQREIPLHMTVQKCHHVIHNLTTVLTNSTFIIILFPVFGTFWKVHVH